jgi:hypothetical protein
LQALQKLVANAIKCTYTYVKRLMWRKFKNSKHCGVYFRVLRCPWLTFTVGVCLKFWTPKSSPYCTHHGSYVNICTPV